jgi:hypothetical protein
MLRTCVALLLLFSVLAPSPEQVWAQDSRDYIEESARWRVGGFVGVARDSPARFLLGITPGRHHYFIGLQVLSPVRWDGSVGIAYAAQLLPFVGIRGRTPPEGYVGRTDADGHIPGPGIAYAFGVSPFGLEVSGRPFRNVSVYVASAAGGLVFRRPFPVPEAARFNFTLEFGGGLLLHTGRGQWLRLGYKYHHLSNAYTARANPGVDGHVFYAGYQVPIRLPR